VVDKKPHKPHKPHKGELVMPSYTKAPHTPLLAVAGFPAYLFGNLPTDTADCRMQVTQVSGDGTTATLSVYVREGNIPVIGQLVTVAGLAHSGFNTTGTALSAVSINASTGIGTISYLNATSQAAVADAGSAIVPIQETTEAYANGASAPVTLQFNDPHTNTARTATLVVTTPANTLTGSPTFVLEEAVVDQDSEYQPIFPDQPTGVSSATAIPTTAQVKLYQYRLNNGRFYRLLLAGGTGGAGTINAKLLL
jgi:hypothetical protein